MENQIKNSLQTPVVAFELVRSHILQNVTDINNKSQTQIQTRFQIQMEQLRDSISPTIEFSTQFQVQMEQLTRAANAIAEFDLPTVDFSSSIAPFEEISRRWARALATSQPSSPLADALQRIQQLTDSALVPWKEACGRWARALAIVRAELPKRGWYLTGDEPITLIEQLAYGAEAKDWTAIDEILLENANQIRLNKDLFQQWLAQHRVPDYCIERVRLVLDHWESGNHEVTTIVGMAVIDELCRCLYDGRDFTTKRNRQPKPQLACRTPGATRELRRFEKEFVETFGSIHKDIEPDRLEDENYFNRAAILHGQMRRKYGPKDSAKVFMILMFLVFGLDDEAQPSPR